MLTAERIKGRLVEIEIGETAGLGWVAVGVVTQGLAHEKGLRFEARGADAVEVDRRLRTEIEASFI